MEAVVAADNESQVAGETDQIVEVVAASAAELYEKELAELTETIVGKHVG